MTDYRSGFDPSRPLEQARTIPASWYFDPEIAKAERDRVFAATWNVAGRAELVAEPGSFLTCQIAGEPLLIVRDQEGVLRGFYNVCRHRAACVINQPAGRATRLRCRYHGWTYDLSGQLIGVPEFDGVADFRREEQGLVPIHVAVWGKWIWVNLSSTPEPLIEYLAPLPAHAEQLGLGGLHFVARREYELRCNWKVFVDNYLDGGYHVNTVHPALAGVLDYSQYRTEIFRRTAAQISPLKSSAESSTVSSVRSGNEAYYWWIFPNFMVNAYSGVMDTNLVLPIDSEHCRVIFDFYFADTSGEFIESSIRVADQIQQEDSDICEEVQRGLGSRSYSTGRFSVRREAAGYHFHRLLAEYLG